MKANSRRRRRRVVATSALSSSSISAGPTQTRWCTQVIGLIRQPSTPVSAKPGHLVAPRPPPGGPGRPRWPSRPATVAIHSDGARVGRVQPGHRAVERLVGDERQGADPVGVPQRVGPEHPGRVRGHAPATSVAAPAVALATSAARHRLVTSR